MMALPPLLAGAVKATVAELLPPVPAPMVGAPGATAVMVKVCDTCGAAPKLAFPAWSAVMVQVPAVTMVILRPLTVHTAVVVDASVTTKPELAVAFEAKAVVLKVLAPGLAKVMVCAPAEITNETTWVAAGALPLDAVTVKPSPTPGFVSVGKQSTNAFGRHASERARRRRARAASA